MAVVNVLKGHDGTLESVLGRMLSFYVGYFTGIGEGYVIRSFSCTGKNNSTYFIVIQAKIDALSF